ncbi:MAG TPA: polyphenol oxidase family protein [Acidimicrobiales bacterium]|nr:polyphenol oxidase family protein [Acidimicrobiales bacterium]
MPVEVTLSPEVRGPLTVYPIADARTYGVDAFVTDRFNGASSGPYDSLNLGGHVGDDPENVGENRRLVARAINADHLVIVRQVHGSDVLEASNVTADSEGDAILSGDSDLALAVLVADCVPILLVESSSSQFCLVHAGWRGLRAGVIARALDQFFEPSRVHAFLGPSISSERYQVGPEVAEHFGDVPGVLLPDVDDRSRLDLRGVAAARLSALGVDDEHISISTQVTDGGDVFFSDRAQRPCGRFGLVAKRVS